MDDTTTTTSDKQDPATPAGQDAAAPVIGGVPDAPGQIQPENSEGKMTGQPTSTSDTETDCAEHPAETWLQQLEDKAQQIADELRDEFLALVAKVREAL